MGSIAASNRAQHVAEILLKIEAALQDVSACRKFGPYGYHLSEKLYFLFSHCSHLMLSLWLADEDSNGVVLCKGCPPAAFTAGLDFEGLREAEYQRGMLYADSIAGHLKNESKWFAVWMQMLERLDPAGEGCFRKFSRMVLQHIEDQTFPERRTGRKDRKRLEELMQEDATGRLLLRSVYVLEDLARSVIRYLGGLDPKTHTAEQIAAVTCLLEQARRTIICDTPAKGPCAPFGARNWKMPLILALSCRGRNPGLLTVVPKRGGGGIVCRYDWASDNERRSHRWTLATSMLPRPYEEGLFTTWSYPTGECQQDSYDPLESRACWTIQKDQAAYLEGIARETDAVLQTLAGCPVCRNLSEAVQGIVRNNRSRWEPGELSWSYIAQLDQVLTGLKFICREAKILEGVNPVERAIMQVWPVPGSLADGQEPVAAETANHAPCPSV